MRDERKEAPANDVTAWHWSGPSTTHCVVDRDAEIPDQLRPG
jgi:hypothetical protein